MTEKEKKIISDEYMMSKIMYKEAKKNNDKRNAVYYEGKKNALLNVGFKLGTEVYKRGNRK